jgi:hypothetical protein
MTDGNASFSAQRFGFESNDADALIAAHPGRRNHYGLRRAVTGSRFLIDPTVWLLLS